MRVPAKLTLVSSTFLTALSCLDLAQAQTELPRIEVTVPTARRAPARPAAPRRTTAATNTTPTTPSTAPASAPATTETQPGVLPVVADKFATITVVPNEEIRRSGAATLGDLLFTKPGIAGSGYAPGASSRPIIRGLDVNRVGIVENGVGASGASDLGEDHFVPVDPLTSNQVEVIRGPATLRYGSQAIGGVVSSSDNRIPDKIPERGVTGELRGNATSASRGIDGAVLLDAGGGNPANGFAMHVDAFGRRASDYRVPSYPYLTPPDPADAPNATQPGAFNGRQPNTGMTANGQSVGASHFFAGGYNGIAVSQMNTLYRIPGIEAENFNTRIDAQQTRLTGKGEYRPDASAIDAVRYWWGATDYRHNEIGLADASDSTSAGVRQTFTNREQEGRIETSFAPLVLPFAELATSVGAQAGHQKLTAESPDNNGLWDPNRNSRVAAYVFNEFRFTPTTRAQLAGRIEHVDLAGFARTFLLAGGLVSMPVSPSFTPKSGSVGLLHDLPWNLVASITGQYVERAPKPAELFSGGPHDATGTFDKGNANLGIEKAASVEIGLRRAAGPFRFEATAYATKFSGFIYRSLTGNTCDEDTAVCGPGIGELREAVYTQRNATFRGAEFQSQLDVAPLASGMFGIENQFDVVRATFEDGTSVPRIPPLRVGGSVFWRDATWLARVNVIHAFAQRNIAIAGETPTAGYNDLRAEISYRTKINSPTFGLSEFAVGLVGTNLLNADIRNHVSYNKDEVLMPGASVRAFATVKF